MRRIAAYIYKKAGRWKQSIALLKKDNLYKDAMETCSQSGDRELSKELLVYFIEKVLGLITSTYLSTFGCADIFYCSVLIVIYGRNSLHFLSYIQILFLNHLIRFLPN